MSIIDKTLGSELRVPYKVVKESISVIIPVYNEENCIEEIVSKLQTILFDSDLSFEIIVVDDGSTDRSAEILQYVEGIKFLRHQQNIGYGGALKTGLKNAAGDIIVITDADGTYPNELIPGLIKEMSEFDMVVGARNLNSKNISLLRKPAKFILGKLANYLAETQIPDLNSGLRVFRKDRAFQFYRLFPSGFSFTTTITLAMHCNGYKVKYVPIEYGKREGKSKIRPVRDTLNFLQLIGRTVMYFNPMKIFLPIAIFIFIGFFISSVADVFSSNLTDKTVILFLAFIQVTIIGLLADLIDKRNS